MMRVLSVRARFLAALSACIRPEGDREGGGEEDDAAAKEDAAAAAEVDDIEEEVDVARGAEETADEKSVEESRIRFESFRSSSTEGSLGRDANSSEAEKDRSTSSHSVLGVVIG